MALQERFSRLALIGGTEIEGDFRPTAFTIDGVPVALAGTVSGQWDGLMLDPWYADSEVTIPWGSVVWAVATVKVAAANG